MGVDSLGPSGGLLVFWLDEVRVQVLSMNMNMAGQNEEFYISCLWDARFTSKD